MQKGRQARLVGMPFCRGFRRLAGCLQSKGDPHNRLGLGQALIISGLEGCGATSREGDPRETSSLGCMGGSSKGLHGGQFKGYTHTTYRADEHGSSPAGRNNRSSASTSESHKRVALALTLTLRTVHEPTVGHEGKWHYLHIRTHATVVLHRCQLGGGHHGASAWWPQGGLHMCTMHPHLLLPAPLYSALFPCPCPPGHTSQRSA